MRWSRAALPLLLGVEAVAIGTGRMDLRTGATGVVLLEVTLTAVILARIALEARRHEGPFLDRVQAGLSQIMPEVAAALIVGEVRMARSLVLLAGRRTDTLGDASALPIPYAAGRLVMPTVMGIVGIIEMVAIDVIVPWGRLGTWSWLRWVLLGLSAYGLLWIMAWCAAERTHPHLATRKGLVLRTGPMVVARIPWGVITATRVKARWTPDPTRTMLEAPLVTANLDIDLSEAVPTRRFFRAGPASQAFSIAVDDPDRASHLLEAARRSAAPSPSE